MPAKTRASTRSQRHRGTTPPSRRRSAKPLTHNPFLALVDMVRRDVDTRLSGLLDEKVDAARAQGPEVVDIVRAVRDLCVRGGKRLRAALVVAGYRAASTRGDLEPALDAGVAIELLHTYFLIHDDWMDDDAMRRGGPTVHAHLSKRYRSARLGGAGAILAGDLAVALATEAFANIDVPSERFPPALAAFAEMQLAAVAGQQRDVMARSSDAEQTYMLKTGSYTVAGPLRLGALLAGGSSELASSFDRFAVPAGVAFQIRDDLLSAFGDPKETGKPFANDVTSGKRTLVIEHAFRLAKGRDKTALVRAFGNPKATRSELARAVAIMETSGARAAAEERTNELANRAREAVLALDVSETGRELLLGAVDTLTDRRS